MHEQIRPCVNPECFITFQVIRLFKASNLLMQISDDLDQEKSTSMGSKYVMSFVEY